LILEPATSFLDAAGFSAGVVVLAAHPGTGIATATLSGRLVANHIVGELYCDWCKKECALTLKKMDGAS
jgi:glycine/D-amino acid oxidase-like deaminating enzyme